MCKSWSNETVTNIHSKLKEVQEAQKCSDSEQAVDSVNEWLKIQILHHLEDRGPNNLMRKQL